jgi:hypothetical protein
MSQQQEKVQPCKQCAANKVTTLIQWRLNPDKVGQINPNTGRQYMKPWEVNKNDWHRCQFYSQQTNQMVDRAIQQGTTLAKPQFTPNNQAIENMEKYLAEIAMSTSKMADYLEVLVEDKIKTNGTMKPASASDISDHEHYQNNTGYSEE